MAVVKNLMVRAGADFSAITKQANKAKSSMSGMQTSVSKSCARMTAAVSGLNKVFGALGVSLSVAAIVSFSKSAKAAYDEQTEASAKLAQVMRNTMGARAEEVKSIEDLIDAQERLGVVDGAVQTEAAQELATYLTLSKSLKTLLPVLNDMIAQQYGIGASAESAVSIATMMGKVMNGQTSALSRYGYSFTAAQEAVLKYGTEAQRAAVLAEVVSQSVGGMNAALAATPNGRMEQLEKPEMLIYNDNQVHWLAYKLGIIGEEERYNTPAILAEQLLITDGIFLSNELGRSVTRDEIIEMSPTFNILSQEIDGETVHYDLSV